MPWLWSRVCGLRLRVQGSGIRARAQGPGFRDQGSEIRVQGPGFRDQGSGSRVCVHDSGSRDQGSGSRVQGLWSRDQNMQALCLHLAHAHPSPPTPPHPWKHTHRPLALLHAPLPPHSACIWLTPTPRPELGEGQDWEGSGQSAGHKLCKHRGEVEVGWGGKLAGECR